MTIHVGMIGSDGIVLAGDTLQFADPLVNSAPYRAGISTRMTQTVSKIKVSPNREIAVSCAQDLRQAYELADAIIAGFSQNSADFYEGRIQEIADSYSLTQQAWHGAQCLILTAKPFPALYLLECLVDLKSGQRSPAQCRCVPGYAFDGDCLNGAIYWAMRYYLRLPPTKRTVPHLKRLAVQTVADAAALSSGSIGGLEVVYLDQSGIHQTTISENSILLDEAEQRSTDILNLICPEGIITRF